MSANNAAMQSTYVKRDRGVPVRVGTFTGQCRQTLNNAKCMATGRTTPAEISGFVSCTAPIRQ